MPTSWLYRADLFDEAWYVGFRVTGIAAVRIFADLLEDFARLLSVINAERFAEESGPQSLNGPNSSRFRAPDR